jgi:hypothetical protein
MKALLVGLSGGMAEDNCEVVVELWCGDEPTHEGQNAAPPCALRD